MTATPPRLIYCGMFGTLSRLPLLALLDAGHDIRAVVVPPRGGAVVLAQSSVRTLPPPAPSHPRPASFAALLARTVVELAWERDIPVLEIGRFDREALAALAALTPSLIAVSCFPLLFPPALLDLPSLGVLNLHPALLPRGRGPDPLFWAFRERRPHLAGQGGVTIHLMARALDAGPIVAQGQVELHDGMREAELELRLAALGSELLVGAVRSLAAGTARPTPQDARLATTYPLPTATDFVITPDRPARWAFNFMRGTAGRGGPHRLAIGDRAWPVRAAHGYAPEGQLGEPYRQDGPDLLVQCSPGILRLAVGAAD